MHSNKNFNLPDSVIKAAQQSMSAGVVALTKVEAELIEAKKKKLDPVGKEDADVNNDGKVDKSDSYLKNRRSAIKAAMKEEVEQVDEASYSAKAARAGKDIGKPGKMFSKIAAKAAKRYGSEEAGKRVAGAILKKLRNEEVALFTDKEVEDIKSRAERLE